ncbi:aminotransferase class I/II-fold pyridoxal phosphate-dependent enzyme [Rhodobacteraceae bacterium Araon29]
MRRDLWPIWKGFIELKRNTTTFIRPVGFPQSTSRPVVTPLSPSVVYASDSPDMLDDQYDGKLSGFTYAREGHPNGKALSQILDRLEAAENGIVTGSGMSAVTSAIMATLSNGDHIIAGDQLYGRSLRLMGEELPRLGISVTLANASSSQDIARAINPNTKMVLIEGISNPTLRVADLNGISAICKDAGILLAVDNTFTTPKAFQPLKHGADIAIHSVTKLLAGHSDVTLGYVVAKDPNLNKRIYDFAVTTGLTASPFDCWLAERGLLTFDLRFEKAQKTAENLADALAIHPKVARVLYPMRNDHPDVNLAKIHFEENGCNMVSFELADKTRAAANLFTQRLDGIAFAPTLGDVGTTLSHPVSSSHRSMMASDREKNGISEGFFRVSVGLETPEDLISAFKNALDQL